MFANTPLRYPNFLLIKPLLEPYRPLRGDKEKRLEHDAVKEAGLILGYLNLILCRLEFGEDPSEDLFNMSRAEKLIRNFDAGAVDTLAFYYLASRLKDILNNQLKVPIEAKGIRDIRNHLVEHPERKPEHKDNWPYYCFAFGGEEGPTFRPFLTNGEHHASSPDKGLRNNAQHFYETLEQCLKKGKK